MAGLEENWFGDEEREAAAKARVRANMDKIKAKLAESLAAEVTPEEQERHAKFLARHDERFLRPRQAGTATLLDGREIIVSEDLRPRGFSVGDPDGRDD